MYSRGVVRKTRGLILHVDWGNFGIMWSQDTPHNSQHNLMTLPTGLRFFHSQPKTRTLHLTNNSNAPHPTRSPSTFGIKAAQPLTICTYSKQLPSFGWPSILWRQQLPLQQVLLPESFEHWLKRPLAFLSARPNLSSARSLHRRNGMMLGRPVFIRSAAIKRPLKRNTNGAWCHGRIDKLISDCLLFRHAPNMIKLFRSFANVVPES